MATPGLMAPDRDGFKRSNCVSSGPSKHHATEGQELENCGRGEGEGTWRRNWWGNNWERTILLHLVQPLKSSLRASEG